MQSFQHNERGTLKIICNSNTGITKYPILNHIFTLSLRHNTQKNKNLICEFFSRFNILTIFHFQRFRAGINGTLLKRWMVIRNQLTNVRWGGVWHVQLGQSWKIIFKEGASMSWAACHNVPEQLEWSWPLQGARIPPTPRHHYEFQLCHPKVSTSQQRLLRLVMFS